MADDKNSGLSRGLTNYGDPAFSLYLRRSFAKSMGYSGEMLARPVIGIADARSGFNNCHRHFWAWRWTLVGKQPYQPGRRGQHDGPSNSGTRW